MFIHNGGFQRGLKSVSVQTWNRGLTLILSLDAPVLCCSWGLTARSLFARSVTTKIQTVLEPITSHVLANILPFILPLGTFLRFYPTNKGLFNSHTTVIATVGHKITIFSAKKNRPYPSPPIANIGGGRHKNILQFSVKRKEVLWK